MPPVRTPRGRGRGRPRGRGQGGAAAAPRAEAVPSGRGRGRPRGSGRGRAAAAVPPPPEVPSGEAGTSGGKFECPLCTSKFPIEDMVDMLGCEHRACVACTKKYFSNEINGKMFSIITCHTCHKPEFKTAVDGYNVSDYLSMLDQLLRTFISEKDYQMYEKKLLNLTLSKDPNFKWCGHCPAGYLSGDEVNYRTKVCPHCKIESCVKCDIKYPEHKSKTCEQVAAARRMDAEVAFEAEVQKFLGNFGIECPRCKFQFELAKGGCLHFRCLQCRADFCGGCKQDFSVGAACRKSPNCRAMGLHAHHPRNCMYYLRSYPMQKLAGLLCSANIEFGLHAYSAAPETGCIVMEQQRVDGEYVDVRCTRKRERSHMCALHHTEHLCDLIFKSNLDPISIFTDVELEQEAEKHGLALPARGASYRADLLELIKTSAPLEPRL